MTVPNKALFPSEISWIGLPLSKYLSVFWCSRRSVCSRCPSEWPVKLYSRVSLAGSSSVFHGPPSSQFQRLMNSGISLPQQRPHFSALIFVLVTFPAAATKDMIKTTWARRLSFCSWFGRIWFVKTEETGQQERRAVDQRTPAGRKLRVVNVVLTSLSSASVVCLFNVRPQPKRWSHKHSGLVFLP